MSSSLTDEEIFFNSNDPKPVSHFIGSLIKLFDEVAPNAPSEHKELLETLTGKIAQSEIETIKKIEENGQQHIQQINDQAKARQIEFNKIEKFAKKKNNDSLEQDWTDASAEKDRLEREKEMIVEEKAILEEKIKNMPEEHRMKIDQLTKERSDMGLKLAVQIADLNIQRHTKTEF